MNKFLTSVAALALMSSAAFAADLPSKKAPAMAPIMAPAFNWTGAYVGLQGGYAWSRATWNYANATSAPQNGHGAFIGAKIGYNYQFANNLVAGVELEGNASSLKGTVSCPNNAYNCGHKIRSFGSLDARLGYAYDRMLFSVTGGVAMANVKYSAVSVPTGALFGTGYSKSSTGFALGAGVDYALTNNIIASLGYKYYGFGKSTAGVNALGGVSTVVKPSISAVTAGVSYKF